MLTVTSATARPAVLTLALLLAVVPAWAHAGEGSVRAAWWRAWDLDPALLLALAAAWSVYARGALALWRRAGGGRGATRGQVAAFSGGMVALTAALASPLDAMSGELASAHMAQRELLMMPAAPLLALGTPVAVLLAALPGRARRLAARAIRRLEGWYAPGRRPAQALGALAVYALAPWAWHAPALYDAALHSRPLHDLEHLAFLAAALLFLRVLLDPAPRMRLDRGAGVLYLFAACLRAGALGIYVALSRRVWYAAYAGPTAAANWGMTPLEDQQLAGLIMWVPARAHPHRAAADRIHARPAAWPAARRPTTVAGACGQPIVADEGTVRGGRGGARARRGGAGAARLAAAAVAPGWSAPGGDSRRAPAAIAR